MTLDLSSLRELLNSFEFKRLFVGNLGWDRHAGKLSVEVAGKAYTLEGLAEKRGVQIFECRATDGNPLPDYNIRKKIEKKVTESAHEHLIVFTDSAQTIQIWQWVARSPNKPDAYREITHYPSKQTGELLVQKLQSLRFALSEEESIDIIGALHRLRDAFDRDSVTKKFYDLFKKEHTIFMEHIKGFPPPEKKQKFHPDQEWYTSLMLNRVMFVYFIQKKGFLDGDRNYLRNRLTMVQKARGKDKFHSFYRYFLLQLFHEGLGQRKEKRQFDPVLEKLIGDVPYLNGGFFEVHQLEEHNSNIDIPDEAFEQVFDFFDSYDWHLDERPLHRNDEINPDVLGYIFEKYINQKEMGAYYTKEDITEYISKNTILPYLFDAARKKCPIAFKPDSATWKLLRDDPNRYIYPSMRKGVIDERGKVISLPKDIAIGIKDVSKRGDWNRLAEETYSLPTETWREYIARREHCLGARKKLSKGEVHEISDLVTLNLNIWQFVCDAIVYAEGPELLRAFWHTLAGKVPAKSNGKIEPGITILDPTCGSGAFLFAALRILETLYGDCLERMQRFIEEDNAKMQDKKGGNRYEDFRQIIEQIKKHPSEQYFILKSIIINNLFGVDIMREAVEICKLRLFLKLVAQVETLDQIEPLPDIDFNICAGNTLVGYANADEVRKAFEEEQSGHGIQAKLVSEADKESYMKFRDELKILDNAFKQFRSQQTTHGGLVTTEDKQKLRNRLSKLSGKLDFHLASAYGKDANKQEEFEEWETAHVPFHWFVEFYGIMSDGGFDVIIGNPPYLELAQIDYTPSPFKTYKSGAIHAMCVERSLSLLGGTGAISMIVPMSLVSTQRMSLAQNLIETGALTWYANFAWRPGKLFDTVNRALTIFIACRSKNKKDLTHSTGYQKWNSDNRDSLIPTMMYCEAIKARPSFWVPKIENTLEISILNKILNSDKNISSFMGGNSHQVYYRHTGGLYWKVFTDFFPAFTCNGNPEHSSTTTSFSLAKSSHVRPIIAILSSDVFWWWYTITSNLRDLNPYYIQDFPIPVKALTDGRISHLGQLYIKDLKKNSTMLIRKQKQTGTTETQSFKVQKSKHIINKIDRVLSKHYRFTDEELDFIINYDIKYRMGDALVDGADK